MEPFEELRYLLNWRRSGDDGRIESVPFDRAWELSISEVLKHARAASGHPGREWWAATFTEQRSAWERAYDLEPAPRRESSVTLLKVGREVPLSDAELQAQLPGAQERVCAHCRGVWGRMEGRPATGVYCGRRCKREANYQRERERVERVQREEAEAIFDAGREAVVAALLGRRQPTNVTPSILQPSETASDGPRVPLAA